MNWKQIFEDLGFTYMGPCRCRQSKGYIFRHPSNFNMEAWIYPGPKRIKIREYDVNKTTLPYTEETLQTIVEALV